MAKITNRPVILVADDTPENVLILDTILSGNYEVLTAATGDQALAIAQDRLPDLILLDVMMPGLDGYEVCRRLKADDRTCEIPVIFITALANADNEARGLELGAIDYMAKPFRVNIVRARVKNHLALREAAKLREDVECIMRHDLRSPLTTILSLPELMLMDDNLTDGQRDMLQRITEAGYIMLALINLSKTLIKMERGNYSVQPERTDLVLLVRKVFANFEDTAEMRDLTLELRVNGEPATPRTTFCLMAEELLCYSMLDNLIRNAVEASPGHERITVSIRSLDSGEVRIDIVNRGTIPPEIRENFFGKYVTSGKTKGTGLGTYSARLIALAHRGDITMHFDGETVTVSIILPAATATCAQPTSGLSVP